MQEPVNAAPTRATLRANWIAALRSGKYKQGKRKLRVEDRYCCLGVACEVLGIEGVKDSEGYYCYSNLFAVAPQKVVEELGLINEVGSRNDGSTNLTRLNDEGKTFEEIANELESGAYFIREPEKVG